MVVGIGANIRYTAVTFTKITAMQKIEKMSEYMVCMTSVMLPSAPITIVEVCRDAFRFLGR